MEHDGNAVPHAPAAGARTPVSSPKISVVMPVMNEERFIRSSIDSILAQTFRDFEFLIIDDGSTDDTPAILKEYAALDARIRIIRNEQNQGISRSLNIGLREARGDYIARMDGDDLNTPDRFEKQALLLDDNPDIVVAGAGYQTISANDAPRHTVVEGTERWECDWLSIFRSTILHSIMMYRRDVIVTHDVYYDPEFEYAEDVEFAHRLLQHGDALCLPDVMLLRRFHPTNTTSRNFQRQRDAARRAAVMNAHRRFPQISEADLHTLFAYLKPPVGKAPQDFEGALRAMNLIEKIFSRQHGLNTQQIKKMRNYSARWLAAAAMSGGIVDKAVSVFHLAIAGASYFPNFSTEALAWMQRRIDVRSISDPAKTITEPYGVAT